MYLYLYLYLLDIYLVYHGYYEGYIHNDNITYMIILCFIFKLLGFVRIHTRIIIIDIMYYLSKVTILAIYYF